jgi:hypothetical protein
MTANRKADLQRKLTLRPVPEPPPGLADRIKSEIPPTLIGDSEDDRRRLRRAVFFDVRVAASILLLVSSLYLVLHLLSRTPGRPAASVAELDNMKQAEPPRPTRAFSVRSDTAPPPPPAKEEPPIVATARLDRVQSAEDVTVAVRKATGAATAPPTTTDATAVATNEPAVAERITVTNSASAAVAAAPPPPKPVPPPPVPASAQSPAPVAKTAYRSEVVPQLAAAEFALKPAATFFGLPTIYASHVDRTDPAAVVQRFAAPPSRPKREVRLDTELVAHPLEKGRAILRVSIDAPASPPAAPNASVPPAASDVRIEVDLASPPAVGAIAFSKPIEPLVLDGSTVTAIYDVPSEPGRIATVRLTSRSARDGKTRTTTKTLSGEDLRAWPRASPRTKNAALAALWAEAVRVNAPTEAIRAEAERAGAAELAAFMSESAPP